MGDVVALHTGDFQPVQAEFAGDVDHQQCGGARIGDAHVGHDLGSVGMAMRENAAHAGTELRVIASIGVEHAVAVAERHRTLANAFEHEVIERPTLREVHGRSQPIGGEAGAAAKADGVHGSLSLSVGEEGRWNRRVSSTLQRYTDSPIHHSRTDSAPSEASRFMAVGIMLHRTIFFLPSANRAPR